MQDSRWYMNVRHTANRANVCNHNLMVYHERFQLLSKTRKK